MGSLEVSNIDEVKTGHGKILVRPLKENTSIVIGGHTFFINTTYRPEAHSVSAGEVISSYHPEIQCGDVAVFHYLSTLNAIRDKRYLTKGKEIYYSVAEESVYMVRRGQAIIPVNGYMLVSPLKQYELDKIGKIYLPENFSKKEKASRGIVKYLGSGAHLANVGDEIIFRKTSSVPIQYELHQILPEKLFRMKSDSVLAIV